MYVLDTNAIRYLGERPRTSPEAHRALRQSADSGGLRLAYSPLSVVEILSALQKYPELFPSIRRSVQRLLGFGAEPLPTPEDRIRELATGTTPVWQRRRVWHNVLNEITSAREPAELTFLVRKANEHRAMELDEYVSRFTTRFFPTLEAKGCSRVPLRGADLRTFISGLDTNEVGNAILSVALSEAGIEPPVPQESAAALRDKFRFFIKGWAFLLRTVVQDGRLPQKGDHRNDYYDARLLLYLTPQDDAVLVTDDRHGVLGKFRAAFPARVLRYGEFLKAVPKK